MEINKIPRWIVVTLVFVISFLYIFNLTVNVNPNWESNLFIEGSSNAPFSKLMIEMFKVNSETLLHSHGPVNGIYYKIMFSLFGYDFYSYRIVKSLFFAGAITFFFLICSIFLERKYAIGATGFVLFSLPIFIQTLVFDEGFIIGEFFKLAAIYFFIVDTDRKKTSIKSQLLILVLAIRTYTAAFSIVGIFTLYLLFVHRKKIKHYIPLLILIVLTKIPLSSGLHFGSQKYGLNLFVLKGFLFNDLSRYVFSPVPVYSSLYYRPLVSIVTFFGFWMLILFIALLIFKKSLHKKLPNYFRDFKLKLDKRNVFIFFAIWIICEAPIFLILPEQGIRYAAAIMTPFAGMLCLLFQESAEVFRKKHKKVIILSILFILVLATNFSYAALFRATWGSAFIGMEKTSTYILESELEEGEKADLYYYATSVAPEYIAVDKTRTDKYTVSDRLVPRRIDLNSFNKQLDEAGKESSNVSTYVVKRITSFQNSQFPPVDIDSLEDLELIKTIEGKGPNLFDKSIGFAAEIIGIPYNPNIFYVYKLE